MSILKATVLEEMPPFPERESSILAILKKKKPGRAVEPIDINAAKDGTQPISISMNETTAPSHQNGQTDLLVDVLGDLYSNQSQTGATGLVNNSIGNPASQQNNLGGGEPIDNLKKLFWKNNGVLFENDMLQIGVKAEYRLNLGRMTLFYGNKSALPLLVRPFCFVLISVNII